MTTSTYPLIIESAFPRTPQVVLASPPTLMIAKPALQDISKLQITLALFTQRIYVKPLNLIPMLVPLASTGSSCRHLTALSTLLGTALLSKLLPIIATLVLSSTTRRPMVLLHNQIVSL
jgi:hypothetical protein